MKRAILIVLPFLMWASLLAAAEKYGDATLQQGAMTIVREGQSLQFQTPNEPIPVFEQDLLRLRKDSSAVLRSREKSTLNLGSNAVFQVKPWETKRDQGLLRALYGRFRAAVSDLVGGEQFNVKTSTATIGVKGTEYLVSVTTQGDAMLVVEKNNVEMTGQIGDPQLVGEGYVSVVVGAKPATTPAPVPPQVRNQLSGNNLNSPSPTSNAGKNLPGEEGLVEAGIVEQSDLDESKEDVGPEGPGGDEGPEAPDVQPDLEEAKENLFRANVEILFQ